MATNAEKNLILVQTKTMTVLTRYITSAPDRNYKLGKHASICSGTEKKELSIAPVDGTGGGIHS